MMAPVRMRNFYWVAVLLVWALFGCGQVAAVDRGKIGAQPSSTHVARTGGGAVALSRDERVAVVTYRSAGLVSVFSLTEQGGHTVATNQVEIDTGAGSEPWAAVVGADDDTAYVVFRQPQLVAKITALHSSKPTLQSQRVSVGSEPSAIAISPSGQKLFVANWAEGTVSVITTEDFAQRVKIDLNQTLVDTGSLGTVASRLGLAHPRALAITDNGDDSDDDETLYATEFFSQALPLTKDSSDVSQVDRNRQGFVYPVSLRTGQPGTAIPLAPVQTTGFADGDGNMTSCFPNQLYAAALDSGRLYVTSMCTSPRGPLGVSTQDPTKNNFKTLFHPAVFVVDTATNAELPSQSSLLTQVLDGYYQAGEDATSERMPLIPNDIAFTGGTAGGSSAYVSALGADALFRLDYDGTGALRGIGDPGARYIDVNSRFGLPIGVAVSKSSVHPFALAATDTKQRLSVVDLGAGAPTVSFVDSQTQRALDFRASDENQGRSFFGTGLDIWSYKGQAWSSCESCHPGGLSDGVTWFFVRGPRRTISTAGTYQKTADTDARAQRMLLWGANIDEVHDVEAIVRGVSGGAGAVLWAYADKADNNCRLLFDGSTPPTPSDMEPCFAPKTTNALQNGLNGSLAALDTGTACASNATTCDVNGVPDWHSIDGFIRALRAPTAPTDLDSGDVAAGRDLFRQGRCAGCHGGDGWTVSKRFYQPGAQENGQLPYARPAMGSPLSALPLGDLRQQSYTIADQSLWPLNPAALAGNGTATFRNVPDGSADDVVTDAYTNGMLDQIRCVLRDVGTFPAQPPGSDPNVIGIAPKGALPVFEYRQDMATLAQGATGFNPPSLFGLSVGAPYFHAGNARTLEEVFDDQTFAQHYQSLAPADFLSDPAQRATQVRELVTFLLSIDESSALEPVEAQYDFCSP
jgi:mono/diheme cytochrome c family protein